MRVLTAILLRHPNLLHDVEHAYTGLTLLPPLDRLRQALLEWAHGGARAPDRAHADRAHNDLHGGTQDGPPDETCAAEMLDSDALMSHLSLSGMTAEAEQALAAVPVPLPSCAGLDVMPAEAEAGWWHIFGFLNVDRLKQEVAMAEAAFAHGMTPENQTRLKALKQALIKVESGEPDGIDQAA